MNSLNVGIDISSSELVVCFMDQNGLQLEKAQTFQNSLPGAKKLEKMIVTLANKINAKEILIGTVVYASVYDLHIADFLASNSTLAHLNTSVFRINPKIIKNFKKSYADTDKTDPDDAFAIDDHVTQLILLQ